MPATGMSLHEWVLFASGGAAGVLLTIASFLLARRRVARPDRLSPEKIEAPIGRTTSVPPATTQPTARAAETTHDLEFEVSPSGGVIYRGPKWGIVVACILVALFITGVVLLLRKEKPPQITFNPTITVTTSGDIRTIMDRGMHDPQFDIEPHPNNEVVAGLVGSYYIIDLKDVRARQSLFFSAKQYRKDEFAEDFRSAMSKFRVDVLDHIAQSHAPYRIFVRGSADASGNDAPFISELVGHTPATIEYFPEMPDNPNQFQQTLVSETVPVKYGNRHLPLLRAAYVQQKLQALQLASVVLQGAITGRNAEQDRNAEKDRNATMLLFVRWAERRPPESLPPNSR